MQRLRRFVPGVWVLGCLLMLGPGLALAQEASAPPQPATHDRPELGLSQEQKDQMKQIRKTQREKMQAIRDDSSLSMEDRREKMRGLRKETHSKVNALLTPEQRQKVEQYRKEHRADRRGHRGPGSGPGGQGGPEGPDNF